MLGLLLKEQKVLSFGEAEDKGNPYALLVHMGVLPKINTQLSSIPSVISRYMSKGIKV